MTFEELIEQQREAIEQVVQGLSRKYFLAPPEIEEFRRVAIRALERNSYELLRAFEGKSTWGTYLSTVLTREFFEFQNALWGEWRPSAAAARLGPAAVLLEELVERDHFSVADAAEWMRTTHRVDLPRHRILELAERLGLMPGMSRARRSASTVSPEAPDPGLRHALSDALALLAPDDRLIAQLRFREHQPLTRIARMLSLDARPLQRRIDTIKSTIRQSVVTQGFRGDQVEALLQQADSDRESANQQWWNTVFSGTSK